jgi:aspartyl protease family protein
MNNKIVYYIICTLIAILLFSMLSKHLPNSNDKYSLIQGVIVFSLVLSGFVVSRKDIKITETVKNIGVWVVVFVALIAVHTYKDEIMSSKFMSNLMPRKAITMQNGSLMLTASQNGHFMVEAKLNSRAIGCLIDTGATNIVIDQIMANTGRINTSTLSFDIPISTANGEGMVAKVRMPLFEVGSIRLENVDIYINKEPMGTCLLGMEFLNRLKSFTIEGDNLIMVP